MANTFPRGDNEFLAAIIVFYEYIDANQASFSAFDTARVASLKALRDSFQVSLQNQQQKDAEARAATAQKNIDRKTTEDAFNDAARDLKNDASVDAAAIASAGLNMPDDTPTAVAAPTTRPTGSVDTSQRLEHRISFVDETAATSQKRGKPEGVRACQIWVKIGGEPPSDVKECQFLAEDSASPYLAVYAGADAGKAAYYILRWISTRGETGPISETIAATITG